MRFPGQTLFAACSAVACLGWPAFSGDLVFPAEQFGSVDLVPHQSTSQASIETLGALIDRFELVEGFREDDPLRKFGRPIGRLDFIEKSAAGNLLGVCTATVIDLDKIITNYHCIPGLDGGEITKAEIRLGYLHVGTNESISYKVDVKPLEASRDLDYSILKVHGNPAKLFGTAPLRYRHALDNERLFLIHHPGGQPQRLTRAFCKANSNPISGKELHHRCDTLPGSSGSLVFSQVDDAFVGIHHSGGLAAVDESSFNRATDSAALFSKSKLLKTLCCEPSPAPDELPEVPLGPDGLPIMTGG